MAGFLCSEERSRAKRFRNSHDQNFFHFCRGALRLILASYLDAMPQQLRFQFSSLGKPELAPPFASSQIRFNVSHSGSQVMIAVARGPEVGIDIEKVHPISDLEDIAYDTFSKRENVLLASLDQNGKLAAFYAGWTQKEAYLKGRGLGLNQPLREVEVGLPPLERAGLLMDRRDLSAAELWSLTAWEPAEGFVAALAVQDHNWSVTHLAEDYFYSCWECMAHRQHHL